MIMNFYFKKCIITFCHRNEQSGDSGENKKIFYFKKCIITFRHRNEQSGDSGENKNSQQTELNVPLVVNNYSELCFFRTLKKIRQKTAAHVTHNNNNYSG